MEVKAKGIMKVHAEDTMTIRSWFGVGHASILLENIGEGPLPVHISSSHPCLKAVQEFPDSHRVKQWIDLVFYPKLLRENEKEVILTFETEENPKEIRIKVWKAFWLWPLIVTTLLSILVAYIVS